MSAEDAQLVKTLLTFKHEFDQTHTPLIMSQDGLKTVSKIYYENKFKGILWTNEMNQELPVKCTDYAQTSEGSYSVPWGPEENLLANRMKNMEARRNPNFKSSGSMALDQFILELQT